MSVTGWPRPRSWEHQFLNNGDWYICDLSHSDQTAKESMSRIVQAESWMQEHCEPDSAYRFGGRFYFRNKDDHMQFSLIWM